MLARSTVVKKSATLASSLAAGSLAAGIGYATLIERNAFVVRETTMPVLHAGVLAAAGTPPQRLPHDCRAAPQAGLDSRAGRLGSRPRHQHR